MDDADRITPQDAGEFREIQDYLGELRERLATTPSELTIGEFEELTAAISRLRQRWARKRDEAEVARQENNQPDMVRGLLGREPRPLDSWRRTD